MKTPLFRWHIPLYVSILLSYTATVAVLRFVKPPYNSIALFAVLLAHLFIVAPLKSHTANMCYQIANGEEDRPTFSAQNWRCAVHLQLWLWRARLWRYSIAFLPSVSLSLLSDWLSVRSHLHVYWQVLSWTVGILSVACLVIGNIIAEFSMLRYMAVWYLVARFPRVKHAVQCARQLSLYRMEEIAELWVHSLPFMFSNTRAAWILSQLQSSKHAYNCFQNTNTVTGITDA